MKRETLKKVIETMIYSNRSCSSL